MPTALRLFSFAARFSHSPAAAFPNELVTTVKYFTSNRLVTFGRYRFEHRIYRPYRQFRDERIFRFHVVAAAHFVQDHGRPVSRRRHGGHRHAPCHDVVLVHVGVAVSESVAEKTFAEPETNQGGAFVAHSVSAKTPSSGDGRENADDPAAVKTSAAKNAKNILFMPPLH